MTIKHGKYPNRGMSKAIEGTENGETSSAWRSWGGFVEHVFEQHPKDECASRKQGCGLSCGREIERTDSSRHESTVCLEKTKKFNVSDEAGQMDIQTRVEILFVSKLNVLLCITSNCYNPLEFFILPLSPGKFVINFTFAWVLGVFGVFAFLSHT